MTSFGLSEFLGSEDDEEYSDLQEAMVRVHLEELARPVIQAVGLIIIFFVGGVAEFLQMLYPEEMQRIAMRWRLYMCVFLVVILLLISLFESAKHWINILFAGFYALACFLSGYYLSQARTPNSAAMYIIYIIPLLSIIIPAKFSQRSIITLLALLMVPGIYFGIGWQPSLLIMVTTIVFATSLISILLGHSLFYQLNREAFFRDRELAWQRQQIEFLAEHDQLTGLYDRGIFEQRLEEEFARVERHDLNLSLLMIDLDHFKQINDEYGHQAGDSVLEVMGEILLNHANQNVRQSDVPGRYGGEEFCLLLPETPIDGASTVASRIRESLSEKSFQTEAGEKFEVTCSVGVSEYDESMETAEDLVKEADDALYKAKNQGRDQVQLSS